METSVENETGEGEPKTWQSYYDTWQSYMAKPTTDDSSFVAVLKFYSHPLDARYEDLGNFRSAQFRKGIFRDCMAGLVVAMVVIPMAMGFAVASGLRPEQGIIGGCVAGLIGAAFGGSKYQVYGPTAAFIPVINGVMALYMKGGALYVAGVDDEEVFQRGHGMLVLISLVAAVMLIGLGLARVGTLVAKVPYCILVGFTIGIAFTIVFTFADEALGIPTMAIPKNETLTLQPVNPHIPGDALWPKLGHVHKHIWDVNPYALFLAIGTMISMQLLGRISVFIPSAFMAMVLSTLLSQTVWQDKELRTIFHNYGHIPQQTITFSPPLFHTGDAPSYQVAGIILYYAIAITFVGAVESLFCIRMADSLAGNEGTPFHPNKELWAQGWINAVVPLLNGFPHSGALARTALNIKLGAVTPFAGIIACVLKVAMAFSFSRWLEKIPMPSIAGLLWYVAFNMVSFAQMKQVFEEGRGPHVLVACITAILVVATDIIHGIAFGMIVYAMGYYVTPYLPDSITCIDSDGTDEEKIPMMSSTA